MKKQTKARSIVIEEIFRVWCVDCQCTKWEGELSECLKSGHELIERKLTKQVLRN